MNDYQQPVRQGRTVEELAMLLEDALSAVAGWTVPPPDIHPVDAPAGDVNWRVDLAELDDAMRAAVRNLQARYELRTARPRTRRLSLGSALAWRGGRHLLV